MIYLSILVILLIIALSIWIVKLSREVRTMHTAGLWSKYFRKTKKKKPILLKSKVKREIIRCLPIFIIEILLIIDFPRTPIGKNPIYDIAIIILILSLLIYVNWVGSQVPTKIAITADEIELKGIIIANNKIPITDIEDICVASPGKNQLLTLGSFGCLGFFGMWRDEENGEYRAVFGRRSQCFLVTTKSGQKYMLSCKDRDKVVDLVKSLM